MFGLGARTIAPRLTELRREGERGVTVIEFVVAMALLSILMSMVLAAFTSFGRSLTRGEVTTESTTVAAVGMNEVTRVLRAGTEIEVRANPTDPANLPVFVLAAREEILLHAYIDADSGLDDPPPVLIRFRVDPVSRDLVESRWAATLVNGFWTFPNHLALPTPMSSRVVARKIIPPSPTERSFFTYLRTEGCVVAEPTCDLVPASGNALNAFEINRVVAVEVTMKVQADPSGQADPVTITNRVGIPNLGRSRVGL